MPVLLAVLLILSGCYGMTVEEVPEAAAPDIPADAAPAPINLRQIKVAIPRGVEIGTYSPRGLGLTCRSPYSNVPVRDVTRQFDRTEMTDVFYDTMTSLGYDSTGNPRRMFDIEDDMARTVYAVGARVTDIKMDLCRKTTLLLGYDRGFSGETTIEVEWNVYDRLRQRSAYTVTTRGYARRDVPNYEGIGLLLDDAFASAAHNLGADTGFFNLVVRGLQPDNDRLKGRNPGADLRLYDTDETVTLPAMPESVTPVKPRLEEARRAAVLIMTGYGHGSGFFISEQGHILTNQHVVGDADRVHVVTADRKDKLIAEVLRRDPFRDVALLRLESMPDDLKITLLPIRTGRVTVGEDLYAIGAPIHERYLQDTVTHGIVSAHRIDRLTKLPFIQADVIIHGGNSGGMLLDGLGNIVGICVAGYNDLSGDSTNLNLFIPIDDALDRMKISLPDQP